MVKDKGRGWHKDRQRHSDAAKKGHRRRGQAIELLLDQPSGELYKALTKDMPQRYCPHDNILDINGIYRCGECGLVEEEIAARERAALLDPSATDLMIGGPDPEAEFERGDIRRAVRDVAAKHMKDVQKIESPFALATTQVKQGVKFTGGTLARRRRIQRQIAREFVEQSKVAGRKVSMKDAMKAARRWVT